MTEPKIPKPKSKQLMLEAALRYLGRGWNVIPVKPDKLPHLSTWKEYQHRMATEQEIKEWWSRWPDAGIAVLTGHLSGVVVVDVEAGGAHLATKTLTVMTGGGGRHYYFKHPGTEVPCAVRFLPETDCRGDGGYAVVPPSLHKSGRRYAWDDPKVAIVDIPARFLELLQRGPEQRHPLGADDWEADIPDGERDVGLTRRAGRLLKAGMSEKEAFETLLLINELYCKPPLGQIQIKKIVRSIAGREATKKKDTTRTAQFTVLSQREMLRRYGEDETRWAVAEWLPEASCGLIVAPPGNYKTWILTALGFSVATGRPFLGRYPVIEKGPVLFIQQEDPWWMLENRLSRMFKQREPAQSSGKNPTYELDCRFVQELDEMPFYWYTDRKLSFANRAVLAEMEQKIVELRPRLVMIDPLYTAVDTRDYMAEGAQRMTALKLMRDAYGCSFVVAHHTTVSGSGSMDRSAIWGSQFLNAWLEFGWRIPQGNREGNIVIRHFKDCEDPKRLRVKFVMTDWSFGAEIDEHYTRSIVERIEGMILNGDDLTIRAIAEEVGCSKSTVQRVLRKMDLEEQYKIPSE